MAHFHRAVRSVQYSTLRFGMVHIDPACVSTANCTLAWYAWCMPVSSFILELWGVCSFALTLCSPCLLCLLVLCCFFKSVFLNRSRHQMRITLAEKSILFLSVCISHHYGYYSASRHLNLGTIAGQTKKTLSPILGLGGISSLYDISISRSADILRLPPERLPRTTVRGSVREEKCLLCLKSQTYHRLFFIFGWTNPLTGCTTIWLDRDERSLFKSIGGGLRVFVNNSWATQYCIGGRMHAGFWDFNNLF